MAENMSITTGVQPKLIECILYRFKTMDCCMRKSCPEVQGGFTNMSANVKNDGHLTSGPFDVVAVTVTMVRISTQKDPKKTLYSSLDCPSDLTKHQRR
jgi:hypothetical protein